MSGGGDGRSADGGGEIGRRFEERPGRTRGRRGRIDRGVGRPVALHPGRLVDRGHSLAGRRPLSRRGRRRRRGLMMTCHGLSAEDGGVCDEGTQPQGAQGQQQSSQQASRVDGGESEQKSGRLTIRVGCQTEKDEEKRRTGVEEQGEVGEGLEVGQQQLENGVPEEEDRQQPTEALKWNVRLFFFDNIIYSTQGNAISISV